MIIFPKPLFSKNIDIEQSKTINSIGVEEKLGNIIPLTLTFKDEDNNPLVLGEYLTKPTILLPIFYKCPISCGLQLSRLAETLNHVTSIPGKDYRVLAFSFNENENHRDAKVAKNNYLKILNKNFPRSDWRFITGDLVSIKQLTDAIGFRFKKTGTNSFVHPNTLISLGADGKIIRYLYGDRFLPFDIGMALTEASRGTPGVSIKTVLSYCFDYDPHSKKYVFKTFRILGIMIPVLLGAFYFFFLRKKKTT